MSLVQALSVKIAVGTTAAAVLAGGTAVSVRRESSAPGRQVAQGNAAALPAESNGSTNFEAVVDPATGTVRLVPRAEAAGAGAAGGASAKGAPAARGGAQLSPSAPAAPAGTAAGIPAAIGAGVGAGASGGSSSGGGTLPGSGSVGAGGGASAGSGGSGTTPGGSGGSGGSDPSPGGSVTISPGPKPTLPAPSVPPAPDSLKAHSDGSFTVTVPGTGRVSKRLCLSGTAANKCATVTVPAVQPVQLTVAFSGNAGADKPTFSTAPCQGGASISVSALSSGATVTVSVNGSRLSAKVAERGVRQTASLCDA